MYQNHLDMSPLDLYSLIVDRQLKKFPNGYLDKPAIKEIIRHVIIDKYGYTREEILTKVDREFFKNNYMGGFHKFFEFGESEILIYAFPEMDLKYWEFRKVPPKFWESKENQRSFVCWIANRKKIDITKKEGLRRITADIIQKNGGSKALIYAGGLFELLDSVACGKYKKWEIIKMTSWTEKDIIEATKWLIEEKLLFTPEQVCNIKVEDFVKYNLGGMLQRGCNHSIITALEFAYPGKYYRTKSRGIFLKK